MRTDYKIGIAVILFVLGVIVAYNMFFPTAQPPDSLAQTTPQNQSKLAALPQTDNALGVARRERAETVIAGLGAGYVAPSADNETSVGTDHSAASGDPGNTDASITSSDDTITPALPAAAMGGNGAGTVGAGESARSGSAEASWPSGQQVYVVRQGDSGFWTVSENAYGHGKHWHVIAKANPNADSNALRPGQILKTPPLPRRRVSARRKALAGKTVTESSGVKYYYVRDGDAGFWAVAQHAYGHGKHWTLIAKANPTANSDALRTGQKLIVPPLPTASKAPRAGGNAPTGDALRPGETWYIVQAGDNGFWDVAKRSYGSGKHWELIADANPDVNASALRPGSKLRVPRRSSAH